MIIYIKTLKDQVAHIELLEINIFKILASNKAIQLSLKNKKISNINCCYFLV